MKINASTKVAKFACSLLTVIILLVGSGRLATAANLITNGDFETGNFAGWTVTPAATGSNLLVAPNPFGPDFTQGAFFGATLNDLDAISQTFATTPGVFYDLTFFYQVLGNNLGVPPDNEFNVLWNGVSVDTSLFPQSDVNPGFGTFDFMLQATGTMTTLEFEGRNAPSFDFLDNVSVTAAGVPEPSSYIGALFGLVGLCWFQRRWLMTRLLSLRSA
jgi:PEP-CTERM motif.